MNWEISLNEFLIFLRSSQSLEGERRKNEPLIKRALMAPIWTRIGAPCIIFREESEYDTPRAQSCGKTTKIKERHGLLMKWVAVAPIWLRICVFCIIFREESEYGTPGAQF